MKKLLSMMSATVLTVGVARSTQAQPFIDLNPKNLQSKLVAKPVESPAIESAAIEFPTALKPASTTIARSSNVPDRSTSCVTDDHDRLVAIAPTELFEGGANSLVAKAVGSAEGTRTPDGGRTRAYYGHIDPGNGRWNMGSFSYQHGATSPEEADQRQLDRLWQQFEIIRQSASSAGLRLGLSAQLNGIDLANQAPLAALDQGGYIDRLQQACDRGLQGSEAVLQARTYSYLNPRTNQWDAPGLGNTVGSISRDQSRRQSAISEALSIYQRVDRSTIATRSE